MEQPVTDPPTYDSTVRRGLIAPDRIADLRALLVRASRELDSYKGSVGHLFASPGTRDLAIGIMDWFWASPIPRLFAERHGERPAAVLNFTTIRHHARGQDSTHAPWHLDANFLGFGGPLMVGWVPVDPVGRQAPGLDLALPTGPVPRSHLARYWAANLNRERYDIDDAEIRAAYGGVPFEVRTPVLEPGDLLTFDQSLFHRTQSIAGASRDRTAIEFRMVGPSDPPERLRRPNGFILGYEPENAPWFTRRSVDLIPPAPTGR